MNDELEHVWIGPTPGDLVQVNGHVAVYNRFWNKSYDMKLLYMLKSDDICVVLGCVEHERDWFYLVSSHLGIGWILRASLL